VLRDVHQLGDDLVQRIVLSFLGSAWAAHHRTRHVPHKFRCQLDCAASTSSSFVQRAILHSLLWHASTSVFKLGLSIDENDEDADDDNMEDFPRCPSHEGPQDMTSPRPTHQPSPLLEGLRAVAGSGTAPPPTARKSERHSAMHGIEPIRVVAFVYRPGVLSFSMLGAAKQSAVHKAFITKAYLCASSGHHRQSIQNRTFMYCRSDGNCLRCVGW
jgi:hypothetical protein